MTRPAVTVTEYVNQRYPELAEKAPGFYRVTLSLFNQVASHGDLEGVQPDAEPLDRLSLQAKKDIAATIRSGGGELTEYAWSLLKPDWECHCGDSLCRLCGGES